MLLTFHDMSIHRPDLLATLESVASRFLSAYLGRRIRAKLCERLLLAEHTELNHGTEHTDLNHGTEPLGSGNTDI